ncbi:unnamed protein product, partial [marine sediment metagenome]
SIDHDNSIGALVFIVPNALNSGNVRQGKPASKTSQV